MSSLWFSNRIYIYMKSQNHIFLKPEETVMSLNSIFSFTNEKRHSCGDEISSQESVDLKIWSMILLTLSSIISLTLLLYMQFNFNNVPHHHSAIWTCFFFFLYSRHLWLYLKESPNSYVTRVRSLCCSFYSFQ